MNDQTTKKLVENSIAAALSAIEIYNKPQFTYRNEVFCILIVNAWELLFKAKILSDNGNDIKAIQIHDNKGNLKLNRNNAPFTIEIYSAMEEIKVPQPLYKNISSLIDIRDTSIHYISSQPIDYLVYSLGAACLRNYQKCIKEWFQRDLLEFNFYIMPLGFAQHFKTFQMLDLSKEPNEIKRLITAISENQRETKEESGFVFNCEIQINFISAKKITSETDLEVAINQSSKEVVVVEKPQKLTHTYPYSSDELWKKVHSEVPSMKQSHFYKFLKEKDIKENPKYSAYNFRTKKLEDEYYKTQRLPKATTSIYNKDCVAFMIQEMPNFIIE